MGEGWVGVERGKSGKGGRYVPTYLSLPYLEHYIFCGEDGWLDGDLSVMHGLKSGILDEMDVFG